MEQRLPDHVTSPRLTLRQWVESDVDPLAAAIAASTEHLRPWMPWIEAEPLDREQRLALIRTWRAGWERGGDSVVGLFDVDGCVVGGSGLHRRRGPGVLEIGYWVGFDHIRQGYATEATRALTAAALSVEGIDRVEIHHDRANVASGRVPKALGYTFADEHDRAAVAPAETGVDWRWTMQRDDWRSG
ncbi:MAG: GNAT family protein [Ilumatobacteraceae bacterium]